MKKTIYIVTFIFFLLILFQTEMYRKMKKKNKNLTEQVQKITAQKNTAEYVTTSYVNSYFKDITTLNKKNVYRFLILFEIKQPDIVIKQIQYETGNYECTNCCIDGNNITGFRKNVKGIVYYKYAHWILSLAHYKRWQDDVYDEDLQPNYYQFLLDIGYAEGEEYINHLKLM